MVTTINEAANQSIVIRTLKVNDRLYQQLKELANARRIQIGCLIDEAIELYLEETENYTGRKPKRKKVRIST